MGKGYIYQSGGQIWPSAIMMTTILGLLLSLVAPLLLLPVEKFLPYPHFIEETVKLAVVVIMIKAEKETKESFAVWVFIAGFLFAISESILYLTNIFALGNLMLFPQRLAMTGGLHTSTMMFMYFLGRKNYWGLTVGFVGAVLIHYFFNLWMGSL